MALLGYARVSTDGQSVAAQEAQLRAAGCVRVYSETACGARSDRAQLAKLKKRIASGDVLLVTRLDRLARSTRDLLNTLHELADRKVGFKSLSDTWGGHDYGAWPVNADRARGSS
jgi:DNA invertase Pin-like site-specific DNA recombinase